jgi:hypothetical protein
LAGGSVSNRIIHFDAEIPHRAFNLAMPEEQLDGPQISGAPVDERSLGPSQRVRPVEMRIEPNTRQPVG